MKTEAQLLAVIERHLARVNSVRANCVQYPGARPAPPVTRLSDFPGVYFAQWETFIKIGSSGHVVQRVNNLHFGIPIGKVVPLAWIPVFWNPRSDVQSGDHEGRIHELLAPHRVRGEWFEDCPTVRRFIDRYGYPWPTTVKGLKVNVRGERHRD